MRRAAIPIAILLAIALLAWLFRGDGAPRLAPRLAPPIAPTAAATRDEAPLPDALDVEPLAARDEVAAEALDEAEGLDLSPAEIETFLRPNGRPPSTTGNTPGRIVLREVDGREIAAGTGILEGWLKHRNGGVGSGPIAVQDGRFRLELPAGRRFEPTRIELDGALAWAAEGPVELDAAGELVIQAKRVPPLRLHVIDATTQQELDGVTIVFGGVNFIDEQDRQDEIDDDGRIARGARSPLDLKPPLRHSAIEWQADVQIRAPGHAWTTARLDFRQGGEPFVPLAAGADLEVTIEGTFERGAAGPWHGDSEPPQLRLRKPAADAATPTDPSLLLARAREAIAELDEDERAAAFPDGVPDDAALLALVEAEQRQRQRHRGSAKLIAARSPAKEGATRFEGMSSGRYLVALEHGDHSKQPRILAESEVELRAGTTSSVRLVARPPELPAAAPFAGRVRFSPNWNQQSRFAIHLDLRFEPVAVPGSSSAEAFDLSVPPRGSVDGPEWHRFDAGRRLPGRWLVKSDLFHFQAIVDTGPSGSDALEIVIGDPADAWIKLLDARTGKTIAFDDPRALQWWCERPAESRGGSLEDAEWDAEAGAWHLRAPAGRVGLSLQGDAQQRYVEPDAWVIALQPGRNDLAFTLAATQSLELRLELDVRPLPRASGRIDFEIDRSSAFAVNSADGQRLRGESWGDSKLWFRFPKPGRWRIEVAELPGYAKVEPFEIDVAEGEFVVRSVALVPAQ